MSANGSVLLDTKLKRLKSLVSRRKEEHEPPLKRNNTARPLSQLYYISLSSNKVEQEQPQKRRSTYHFGDSKLVRARTVLGLESREKRAIRLWNQLKEQEYIDNLVLRQPSQKNHVMMKFIFHELSETEKSYNNLLKLIKHRYMHPMMAASQSKDPLVKSTDIPILFNHLTELVQLSDNLIIHFESTNVNVGYTFQTYESDLVVFLKYVMHYKINIKPIKRACNNVLFVKIDQETCSQRDTNRLGMSDYFIAPIQRIPRYCLLIRDLQKYTDPLDPTFNDLNLALKILTGLATAMNS